MSLELLYIYANVIYHTSFFIFYIMNTCIVKPFQIRSIKPKSPPPISPRTQLPRSVKHSDEFDIETIYGPRAHAYNYRKSPVVTVGHLIPSTLRDVYIVDSSLQSLDITQADEDKIVDGLLSLDNIIDYDNYKTQITKAVVSLGECYLAMLIVSLKVVDDTDPRPTNIFASMHSSGKIRGPVALHLSNPNDILLIKFQLDKIKSIIPACDHSISPAYVGYECASPPYAVPIPNEYL